MRLSLSPLPRAMGKVKYCAEPKNASRSAKAAAVDLPTHYKNMSAAPYSSRGSVAEAAR